MSSQPPLIQPTRLTPKLPEFPHELLFIIFRCPELASKDLQSLRLVSRRLEPVASACLLPAIRVSVTSSSLERLENVCRHPSISQGLHSVRIDMSHYGELPEHLGTWFRLHRKVIYHYYRRKGFLIDAESEWKAFVNAGGDERMASERQKRLLYLISTYRRRFEDQQKLFDFGEGSFAERVAAALTNLRKLRLRLDDDFTWDFDKECNCLDRMAWWQPFEDWPILPDGSYDEDVSAYSIMRPPVELILDLFIALDKSGVRPRAIEFAIRRPPNGQSGDLWIADSDQPSIRRTLDKCKAVRFSMPSGPTEYFGCPTEYFGFNVHTLPLLNKEIDHISTLSHALFDSAATRTWHLSFDIKIGNPLRLLPDSASKIERLHLNNMCWDRRDLRRVLETVKQSMTSFSASKISLERGFWWRDVAGDLRDMPKLKRCRLRDITGGEDPEVPKQDFASEEFISTLIDDIVFGGGRA